MNAPAPHPLQARLAHALLHKAARSQGGRAVSLALDANTLPELHHAESPEALAHVALLLEQLHHTGWVALILKPTRAFDTLADRQPTLRLLDPSALAAWSGYTATPPKWSRQLVAALREPGVLNVPDAPALLDYLLRNPLAWFEGLPPSECARLLNGLTATCATQAPLYLRELSAGHFQGHSKVLDARDELLRLLGAHEGQFSEGPIQLLVSLPDRVDGALPFSEVLFIENLITFERMSRCRQTPWAHAALAFASGFRGTARRMRAPAGTSLYWQGLVNAHAAHAFTQWLHEQSMWEMPTSFYGDLDMAGMQILAQLRVSFPACRAWQAGYASLASRLQAGQSHRPEQASKEGQLDPGATGCPYADTVLLPLLRQSGHCVDQESWPDQRLDYRPWVRDA